MLYTINANGEMKQFSTGEVKDYIIAQHKYYSFDSKIAYKKIERQILDGPLDRLHGIEQWFLKAKIGRNFPLAKDGRGSRYSYKRVDGDDVPGIENLIRESKEQLQEYAKANNIAVAIMRLHSDKKNDGKNGITLHLGVDLYELKDKAAMDRYIRKTIKGIITGFFHQWYMHNYSDKDAYHRLNDVLPGNLLKGLIEEDLSWLNFCDKLLEARQPKKEEA